MKVFIGWSGEIAKQLAEFLRGWLSTVIQPLDPWVSEQDILKGSGWAQGIDRALTESGAAIICLTAEGLNSRWVHWEAGALWQRRVPVAPLLIGLEKDDVVEPLKRLQLTEMKKDDVRKLLHSLNVARGEDKPPLIRDAQLAASFDLCWPALHSEFLRISQLKLDPPPARPEVPELVEETLDKVRGLERVVGNFIDSVLEATDEGTGDFAYMPGRVGRSRTSIGPVISARSFGGFAGVRGPSLREIYESKLLPTPTATRLEVKGTWGAGKCPHCGAAESEVVCLVGDCEFLIACRKCEVTGWASDEGGARKDFLAKRGAEPPTSSVAEK